MEVTIKIQLTINGKFYATGPRFYCIEKKYQKKHNATF